MRVTPQIDLEKNPLKIRLRDKDPTPLKETHHVLRGTLHVTTEGLAWYEPGHARPTEEKTWDELMEWMKR